MIWTNFVQSREKDTRKMFNSFQDGIGFGLSCPFRNRFICIYKIYHSQYTKDFKHRLYYNIFRIIETIAISSNNTQYNAVL